MHMDEGARVRKEWAAKGNPPCDHPNYEKEAGYGGYTGDNICTTCGHTWWRG